MQNPFALAAAITSFAYLGVQAVRFRRFVTTLADRLIIELLPAHVATFVAVNFKLVLVITNSHNVPANIIGSRPKTLQLAIVKPDNKTHLLPGDSDLHIEMSLRALSPGQIRLTKWILQLEDKTSLFVHNLAVPCAADVEVAPVLGKIESRVQLGSLASVTRLGTGTDLDRIREVISLDDFHSIDWKSTARTGKFMKKEYSPETEPSVVIVVDTSVLTRSAQVLVQLGKLVAAFISSTPVGLILYNRREVVEQLPATAGTQSRVLVLRALLAGSSTHSDKPTPNGTRLHQELVELIRVLEATAVKPSARRVDVYARSLLPYYETSLTRYPSDLEHQGAFQALNTLSNVSPKLLIVVSSYDGDSRGLGEGAIMANASGHRVILTVIGSSRDSMLPDIVALRESGIQTLYSSGGGLADAIRQAIVNIPMMRIMTPRQLQISRGS